MTAPSPVAPDPHIQAMWTTLTGSRTTATHLPSPTITSLCKEFKAWETLDKLDTDIYDKSPGHRHTPQLEAQQSRGLCQCCNSG